MPKLKPSYILIGLFIVTLAIRLYLSFQQLYFSDDTAYFHLRQVDTIIKTGLPLYEDPLSYGSRTYIFMPIFQYILAFFSSLTLPIVVGKIIPNIFAASLIFIIYGIVKYMTGDEWIALFTAFIGSFIPVYFIETINSISVYTLTIPLTFLLFYLIMKLDGKSSSIAYLCFFMVYLMVHPSIFLFITSFIVYFIMVKTQKITPKKGELEILFFSIILVLWFYFMVFKKAFLTHGYNLVFQNIPTSLLAQFFKEVSIGESLYLIGIVPFIAGICMVYHTVFQRTSRHLFLLTSFTIVITLSMWFKVIELSVALMYLGVALVLLFGSALSEIILYLRQTKFAQYEKYVYVFLIMVFLVTSVVPSIMLSKQKVEQATSRSIIDALSFMGEISESNATTIASSIEQGHTIAYFSGKKNIMDNNFLMIPEINRLSHDLDTILTTHSTTIGTALLNKYNVEFILFTGDIKTKYGNDELPMYTKECFEKTSFREVIVYKNICNVVKSST